MEKNNCKMETSSVGELKLDVNKNDNSVLSELLQEVPLEECPFNFTTAEAFVSALIAPISDVSRFFEEYWEKQHLHIKLDQRTQSEVQSENIKKYFKKLFNLHVLKDIVASFPVEHQADVKMSKYDCLKEKRINAKLKGIARYKKIDEFFQKKDFTIQFLQPQRFHKELWKIQESMECVFGCLVGSNVYITPPGSQGLAPHYDDVEVFILQLEGSKRWRLYKPVKELPQDCSENLNSDDLTLIDEITLNVGDVLYFPRGTIHEAVALPNSGHSTHITISTYQRNSWADYLMTYLSHMVDGDNDLALTLRKGLPINYFDKVSTNDFKSMFSKVANKVTEALCAKIENGASDPVACDFFANRLPPFLYDSDGDRGPPPCNEGFVRLRHLNHIMLCKQSLYDEIDNDEYYAESDDDDDESCDDERRETSDKSYVYVYHSLENCHRTHLNGTPRLRPKGVKFDSACWEGLQQLKKAYPEFIPVQELKCPDLVCLDMLVGLWAQGLLECSRKI